MATEFKGEEAAINNDPPVASSDRGEQRHVIFGRAASCVSERVRASSSRKAIRPSRTHTGVWAAEASGHMHGEGRLVGLLDSGSRGCLSEKEQAEKAPEVRN